MSLFVYLHILWRNQPRGDIVERPVLLLPFSRATLAVMKCRWGVEIVWEHATYIFSLGEFKPLILGSRNMHQTAGLWSRRGSEDPLLLQRFGIQETRDRPAESPVPFISS